MSSKRNSLTLPYDMADYIDATGAIKATIALAFVDGDPAVIAKMLGAFARSRGLSALAKETGLTRNSLYKSLAEDGNPLFTTVARVVDAFGLKLVVIPRPEGRKLRSHEKPARSDVRSAKRTPSQEAEAASQTVARTARSKSAADKAAGLKAKAGTNRTTSTTAVNQKPKRPLTDRLV